MLRKEAIELLNEIANTDPEILQTATQICLDPEESLHCRIMIKSILTEEQKTSLQRIAENRKVIVFEHSLGNWVIE